MASSKTSADARRSGLSWEQMDAARARDLRSDFRDLTAGKRLEQGIELSRLATTLAGRAVRGGTST